MSKNIKTLCFVLVAVLLSTCLFGCANQPLWREDYVDITYDDNGDPIINFSDNLCYANQNTQDVHFFACALYSINFQQSLDASIGQGYMDSLYLVKIIRRFTEDEAKANGFFPNESFWKYNSSTFYEAVIVYDYLREKEINEVIYYASYGKVDCQVEGLPPYSSGDCFITFIHRRMIYPYIAGGVVIAVYPENNKEITMETSVYTLIGVDKNLSSIELEISDEEKICQSEFEKNPRIYYQKFRLGDLIEFIKLNLEECGYEIQK